MSIYHICAKLSTHTHKKVQVKKILDCGGAWYNKKHVKKHAMYYSQSEMIKLYIYICIFVTVHIIGVRKRTMKC